MWFLIASPPDFCFTLRWSSASQDRKRFAESLEINSIPTKVLGGAHYVANQCGNASIFHVLCKICPGSCSGLINFSSSIGGAAATANAAAVVAHYIAQEVPADSAMRMPR